jgi:hypothetical protein
MAVMSNLADCPSTKKFYTEIPNILDDLDLSPYAYRVYGHLKRETGTNGGCIVRTTRQIAERCKMSIGKVVQAKKELVQAGLIDIRQLVNQRGAPAEIAIVDIWSRNSAFYEKRKNERLSTSVHPIHSRRLSNPRTKPPQQNPELKLSNALVVHSSTVTSFNHAVSEQQPQQSKNDPLWDALVKLFNILPSRAEERKDFTEMYSMLKREGATGNQVAHFDEWWKKCDWRGKKGERPKDPKKDVLDSWVEAQSWKSQAKYNPPKPDPTIINSSAVKESPTSEYKVVMERIKGGLKN